MNKNIGIGDFLRQAFTLVNEASREVLVYVLVIGGLGAIGVISGLAPVEAGSVGFNYGFIIDQQSTIGSALFDLLSAAVAIVASYLLVQRYLLVQGRLRTKENRFWPYFGLLILSAIGVILGLILLIVPGIILLVRWSAASGFLVGAGRGVTDSLSDSWHATKGHSWSIFLAAVILFIALALALSIVGGIIGLISGMVAAAIAAFLEAVGNAVAIAFGIGVYSLVHNDTAEIGEVFS